MNQKMMYQPPPFVSSLKQDGFDEKSLAMSSGLMSGQTQ